MQLGFIGTGEIASSIVTGLSSPGVTAHSIWLSPRNSAIANGLANRFRGISVASCNQEVLDHADTIVIAVRPSAARDVLAELRFRPDHRVISLVSALSLRSLSELVVPAVRIARAVSLPSTARRRSAVEIVAALPTVARASERCESPIRAGSQSVGGHPLTLDSSYMSYLEKDG
jgi:pyrroline-5-carboxylate reductase